MGGAPPAPPPRGRAPGGENTPRRPHGGVEAGFKWDGVML